MSERPVFGPTVATITPYLAVADAAAALDWYVAALGAVVVGEPIVMDDGRIGHAELSILGATLYLSDDHPAIGVTAPAPGSGASVTVHIDVVDTDAFHGRAVAAGAVTDRDPQDSPYGRQAVFRDPAGHRWMVMSPAR